MDCERRCAVTVISSRPLVVVSVSVAVAACDTPAYPLKMAEIARLSF
jgi:hypothetical protein